MVDLRPPPTVLQFLATLDTRKEEDKIREFVVAYYLEERSFVVFESHVPNSGFRGGKFMQKAVVTNPKTGAPYAPSDIYVGAVIDLGGWKFVLQEASQDALRVMEANSDVFRKCDLSDLLTIVRKRINGRAPELLIAFQKRDVKKRQRISLEVGQEVLLEFGLTFGDQEFLTLFRRYQIGNSDQFDYSEFVNNVV
jgi:hypothetical protein